MVVRFLPERAGQPETAQPVSDSAREGEKLAEVVELRQRLAPEQLVEAKEPTLSAFDRAVRLLARKPMSTEELAQALRKEQYPEDQVTATVIECLERCYLDDVALAERLVARAEEKKRLSKTALERMLRERKISQLVIENALLEISSESEAEKMREIAQDRYRKLGRVDDETAKRRLIGYLARRGFAGGNVYRVVNEVVESGGF